MVGLAACYTHLPADVALSDHSRKFYDGTYKWDSEGFTDEVGGKCTYSRSDYLDD
jgi:hypothetical protein